MLREQFGSGRYVVVRAPGRVNLIGDHTDYNEGLVLPTTIDRDVYVGVCAREDTRVHVSSLNYCDEVEYDLHQRPEVPAANWESYVTGTIEELRLRDALPSGFEMLVYGNVPPGAGLSSSAALEVAVLFALQSLFDIEMDPIDSARLCQLVEHRYVGVQCGIMDQFASFMGRRGYALYLDCRSLEFEHVPLRISDSEHVIAIVDSTVSRELAHSEYSKRLSECDQIVSVLQQGNSTLRSLRDVDTTMLEAHRDALGDVLFRRAKHVVEENDRVTLACQALIDGSLDVFGRLMNASHASLRDDYEVSIPELDLLVEVAQSTEGVLGARMTGGGFGGCTVNVLHREALPAFKTALSEEYRSRFDREPNVYVLSTNGQRELLYSEP